MIVSKLTAHFQDTIKEMNCQIKKLKTELKRMKDREKELSEDLELTQENISKNLSEYMTENNLPNITSYFEKLLFLPC